MMDRASIVSYPTTASRVNPSPLASASLDNDVEYQTVSVGQIRWNLRRVGKGPVCLLIHGTGASIHTWDYLVPLLSPHYTMIMIDLPGHADTHTPARTDLSLPGIANAVHALLNKEAIRPDMIIGHSAGAAIMMQLCLVNPQPSTQLISINGAIIPFAGIAGYLFSPLARMSSTSGWMSHFFAFRARNSRNVRKLLESTGSEIDDASFERYAQLFQNPSHIAGVLRMMASWQLEKLIPQLSKLPNQVHLIASDNDRTVPLRDAYRLNQLLNHSELSVIRNKGHLVHEEDPAAVFNIIRQHLNIHQPSQER